MPEPAANPGAVRTGFLESWVRQVSAKRVCGKSPLPVGEGQGEGAPLAPQEERGRSDLDSLELELVCHAPSKDRGSLLPGNYDPCPQNAIAPVGGGVS